MHNKKDNIIVFTPDHQIGAVLRLKNGLVKSEFRDKAIESSTKELLTSLETKNPSIKIGASDSSRMSIGFRKVSIDDEKYPEAVVEEINRHGMTAAFASDILLKLLDWVTKNMPKDELKQELGNFLVMNDDDVRVFLDGLKEVYDIVNEK